jgi:nitrite reductase (NADH) small subunit
VSALATRFDLGSVDQIPRGEGRNFLVGGRRVAVFRARDGHLYATQADCPHKGGPLADGLVGGGALICPLHERKFDLTTGQAQGDNGDGSCQLAIFKVTLRGDGGVTIEIPALPA